MSLFVVIHLLNPQLLKKLTLKVKKYFVDFVTGYKVTEKLDSSGIIMYLYRDVLTARLPLLKATLYPVQATIEAQTRFSDMRKRI